MSKGRDIDVGDDKECSDGELDAQDGVHLGHKFRS